MNCIHEGCKSRRMFLKHGKESLPEYVCIKHRRLASIPVREVGDTVAVPFTLFKAVIAEISILINHVLPHIYSGAAIRSPVIKTRQLTDRSPVLLMPWTCWRQMPWNWLHRICWHRSDPSFPEQYLHSDMSHSRSHPHRDGKDRIPYSSP